MEKNKLYSSDPPRPSRENSPTLHQYSCVTCRARKVKCDRIINGCTGCKKAGVHCIYTPRRTQQSQKLQHVLTAQPLVPAERAVNDTTAYHTEERSATLSCSSTSSCSPKYPLPTVNHDDDKNNVNNQNFLIPCEMRGASFQSRIDNPHRDNGGALGDSKSPYANSRKDQQDANFKKVLSNETNRGEANGGLPQLSPKSELLGDAVPSETLNGSFLFNTPNMKRSLRSYHPPAKIISLLWKYYVDNVDILVKVLHKPTAEALVMSCLKDPKTIDAPTEAFVFAIYFSTVTIMSPEECLRQHEEQRSVLLLRYRYAVEQALAQAGLLTTQEVVILQAVILLIVYSPRKDPRSTWILSGTALRIAQAMGMHHDGAPFSLSAIDIEVRRRIWWTLCLIDNCISEDCGLESNIPMTMDTRLPLHINDSDIGTIHTIAPAPKTGFTEMTMSLIKIEMVETILILKFSLYRKCRYSIEDIKTLVRERTSRYESTYLKHLDTSLPLHRLIYLRTRLIIAKLWRMVYDPLQRNNPALLVGEEIKERLLLYNTEIVEITHQLPDRSSKFGWFFVYKYTQWHAMAYLLIELCNQTKGIAVDRAWAALDAVFGDSNYENESTDIYEIEKSILWQSLQNLLKKARNVRKQAALQTQAQGEFADAHMHDSGLDSYNITSFLSEDLIIQATDENSLLGDPFLGSVQDLSEEMNWVNWDSLIQTFQADLIQQQECITDY